MGGGQQSKPNPDSFDQPWREWGHKELLFKDVKEFRTQSGKSIRILLHGPVGAGKSSFINSVNSVLQKRMVCTALADNPSSGGTFTTKYQTHCIQKGQDFYPFVFNDILGLEEKRGVLAEDIILAMKGHVCDGYEMIQTSPLSEKMSAYRQSPTLEDKVHVLVCVIPAVAVSTLSDVMISKIRDIRLAARDQGIPELCILTKIDDVVEKDLQSVYKIKLVKKKMEEFSAAVGVPMNCIFPVANYHEEAELKNDKDVLILTALKQMVYCGEDFINQSITKP